MPAEAVDSEALFAALGRVASGLYVLTVGAGDTAGAMLASWVQQAGFDPPMLSVALGADRPFAQRLAAGEPFAVNVIGEGDKALVSRFGRGDTGQPPLEGIALLDGSPPALADTVAVMRCSVVDSVRAGDHRVFVAQIESGRLLADRPPKTHVRRRGDHY